MQSTDTPIILWPLTYNFAAETRYRLALNKAGIQGRTSFENTYGYTPDISEYTSFSWYQWIWFWEPAKAQSQNWENGVE